ncbi:unnamed protein product [Symbiodinium microadriaticum]|nr:unnamed protein product [Symbiodinium microadriaticum]CAE7941526.1 unnamed protein product [Symbiodinium sp. KB8]
MAFLLPLSDCVAVLFELAQGHPPAATGCISYGQQQDFTSNDTGATGAPLTLLALLAASFARAVCHLRLLPGWLGVLLFLTFVCGARGAQVSAKQGDEQVMSGTSSHQEASASTGRLPSWPPESNAGSSLPRRDPSLLSVLSINAGGITGELYDELCLWLETPTTINALDVVFIQETWRESSDYCLPQWSWIASGKKPVAGQGVAIVINKRLADPAAIRSREVRVGRILQVQVPLRDDHQSRLLNLVNVYVPAKVSESQQVYDKRAAVWNALTSFLEALPSRHLLCLAGDFNTDLLQDPTHVGCTHTLKGKARTVARDQPIFQELLRTHTLQAINTWSNQSTYIDPSGLESRVDFILTKPLQELGTFRCLDSLISRPFAKLAMRDLSRQRPFFNKSALRPFLQPRFADTSKLLPGSGLGVEVANEDGNIGRHSLLKLKRSTARVQIRGEDGRILTPAQEAVAPNMAPAAAWKALAAPLAELDALNGEGWTAKRGTMYADDLRFRWTVHAEEELTEMRKEVRNIFIALREMGMQANPDKSTFLISIRGHQAKEWTKRWIRKDSKGNRHFHFGSDKAERVPVAEQFLYLGAMLSYRGFEVATVRHRIGVAAGHRERLRKILHARRVLSVGHRLRLWKIMAQTSQLYAIEAVGLTAEASKLLHVQTMRHLRAIFGSARHVDGDSDQLFMIKHGIPDCVELVRHRCDTLCKRLRQDIDLPCFDAPSILQWATKVRDALPAPYIAKARTQTPVVTPEAAVTSASQPAIQQGAPSPPPQGTQDADVEAALHLREAILRPMPKACLSLLCFRMCKDLKFFLSCASVGWEALLEQRDLCVDLKQRCALRYQWMPSKSIRKHLRDMHSDQFLPHEQDLLKQEKDLWGDLLPSVGGAAALAKAAQLLATEAEDMDVDRKTGKRLRIPSNNALGSQDKNQKAQGKGRGKGRGKKDAVSMEVQEAVQLMAAVTLQLVDQANRVQLDTSFQMTMKNEAGPENMLPIMYKVWAQWKKIQNEEPSKLDKPLRCSMMVALLMEIKARAQKLLQDEQQQERMKKLEWVDADGRWVYRKWCPKQEDLYLDQTRKPVPQARFIEQIDAAMELLVRPENTPRFQSTRELTPEMKGFAVSFHVDIGLRKEAEPLFQIFTDWVDLQAWVIGAIRIRPHRLKRSPAADRLSQWLGSRNGGR